jgi:hypothetical protein
MLGNVLFVLGLLLVPVALCLLIYPASVQRADTPASHRMRLFGIIVLLMGLLIGLGLYTSPNLLGHAPVDDNAIANAPVKAPAAEVRTPLAFPQESAVKNPPKPLTPPDPNRPNTSVEGVYFPDKDL